MDVRFVCEDCRVKWFVSSTRPIDRAATECAACGGRLMPLEIERENSPATQLGLDSGP
jgi:hypothetical protein